MSAEKPRRPRPQALTVTEAAAARIRDIIAGSDQDILGLKIGLKNAGCAGMSYTLDYVTERAPLDEVVEDKGVTVFIDSKAVLFLIGTVMDYRVDKLSAQFVFENPNQVDACGCGESVNLRPADLVPETASEPAGA